MVDSYHSVSHSPQRTLKQIGSLLIDLTLFLGSGSYGQVYKGYLDPLPLDPLAIKVISLSLPDKELCELTSLITNEVSVMRKLQHDHIVSLKDVRATKNNVYIATEFCPGGDLEAAKMKINPKQAVICLKQMVLAMIYANSLNIIHRDIKPGNILLKDGLLKICDFGFARFVSDPLIYAKMTAKKGTQKYMAPEVFMGEEYNSKCDVWSVGVVFYELIYKYTPWYGKNAPLLFENIKETPLSFREDVEVEEGVQELIRKMLRIDQKKRWDFNKVLEHRVLKNAKIEKLEFEKK